MLTARAAGSDRQTFRTPGCGRVGQVRWVLVMVALLGMLAGVLPAAAADWKAAGGVRVQSEQEGDAKLNFRYWPAPNLTIQSIVAKLGRTKLPVTPATPFPGAGQRAAVMILVDTSDPRRRRSDVKKNIDQIIALAKAAGPHVVFGLATFDTKYQDVLPLGGDAAALEAAAKKLRARGQTTELYRHTRDAINKLAAFKADRKTLILFSDGRAEDIAYTREDVIAAAARAGVSINGFGFSRSVEGTRAFQTLIRLAEETGGRFVEADRKLELPGNVAELIYGALNAGGAASIDLAPAIKRGLGGAQDVKLTFVGSGTEVVLGVTLPPAPVNTSLLQEKNWPWLIGAGAGLLLLLALLIVALRRRGKRKRTSAEAAAAKAAMEKPIAFLQFFDEGEPRFPMAGTAIRIGRRDDNDIKIANTSISAYHAEIQQRRDGTFIITDLDSLNGVAINDENVDVGHLKDGDIVDLGETRFRFEFAVDGADGTAAGGTRKADPATRPDWKIARAAQAGQAPDTDQADQADQTVQAGQVGDRKPRTDDMFPPTEALGETGGKAGPDRAAGSGQADGPGPGPNPVPKPESAND